MPSLLNLGRRLSEISESPITRRVKRWAFFDLKTKHLLLMLSGMFIVTAIAILIYAIDMAQEQKSYDVLMEAASGQRTRIQEQIAEILLASQGHSVDMVSSGKLFEKTLDALKTGGVFEAPGGGRTLRWPPPPTAAIENKLNEQKSLWEVFKQKRDAFLSVPRTDPGSDPALEALLAQGKLVEISAGDVVQLYSSHARRRQDTMIRWQSVIIVHVVLLGLLLTIQARRHQRQLEREMVERKRALWKLHISEENLHQAHAGLEAKVKRRTEELARINRDLETLLYVISHDLKEPLRSIENFSTLLIERYNERLDEKAHSYLTRVTGGAERLHGLLDDILLLSRAQKIGGRIEEIRGETIVREALDRLRDTIQKTGAAVSVEPGLPIFRVEKIWAVEALYNLISNALKFSRPGVPPKIDIGVYRPAGVSEGYCEVGFVVKDRGPGVPPDQSERIFQLFQRGVGRDVEGTGAGLAIVRQVAQGHGGRAWVQPRAGGGSEFYVTFFFVNGGGT